MSIDVHTHLYLPRYAELLRERDVLPFVRKVEGDAEKLFILPDEEKAGGAGGRPFGVNYFDINTKVQAMDDNGISVSVLSLANPWLDFMSGSEASTWATTLNNDLEEMCVESKGRFYGFGVLPLNDPRAAVNELDHLFELPHMKGIIMGTLAGGKGLDDPALDPIWQKLESTKLTAFIHPHYGIGNDSMQGYGHALPLALGFPFETTTAVSRLVLSGALERFPDTKLLLAHSGGTLPFLAGRLDSCTRKDHTIAGKLPNAPSFYLKRLLYDALSYDTSSIRCAQALCGIDNMMWGTDFPFFGHDTEQPWGAVMGLNSEEVDKIKYQNAERILGVTRPKGADEDHKATNEE